MVYILLGDGFEETEATAPYDILNRGGLDVCFAGVNGTLVTGAHGIKFTAECSISDIELDNAEMIVIPGGLGGVECIEGSSTAMEIVANAAKKGIPLGAICAGPRVLAKLGLLKDVDIVCYPGMEDQMTGANASQEHSAVHSGKITTSRGPGTAIDFGFALLEALKDRETAKQVAGAFCYEW